jgi:hypothetical protein
VLKSTLPTRQLLSVIFVLTIFVAYDLFSVLKFCKTTVCVLKSIFAKEIQIVAILLSFSVRVNFARALSKTGSRAKFAPVETTLGKHYLARIVHLPLQTKLEAAGDARA